MGLKLLGIKFKTAVLNYELLTAIKSIISKTLLNNNKRDK